LSAGPASEAAPFEGAEPPPWLEQVPWAQQLGFVLTRGSCRLRSLVSWAWRLWGERMLSRGADTMRGAAEPQSGQSASCAL